MNSTKIYEVWREGYKASGDSCTALFLGYYEASNFKEACIKAVEDNKLSSFNEDTLCVWGCKLFDNETDARLNFG